MRYHARVHAYRSGPPPTRVAVAARTHAGAKHKSNLDAYLVSDFEGYLARDHASLCEPVGGRAAVALAVFSGHFLDWNRSPVEADGAAARGFKITRAAGDAIAEAFVAGAPPFSDQELYERLAQAMSAAGHGVFRASHDRRFIDTAASCTLAVFQQGRLAVIQAGDTRGYLLRNQRLAWVSQGASPDGYGGPNAAKPPPLGVPAPPPPGAPAPPLPPLYAYDLRPGDTMMLCSRGVTATLDERRLLGILLGSPSLDAAAKSILDAALAQRSEHDATIVLAALLE